MMDPTFMKPLAPLVLPAVYDDVLSYEEWLSKVIARMNEINEYVNQTIGDIDDLVERMVNQKTATMDSQIENLQVTVRGLEKDLLALENTLNAKIEQGDSETLAEAKRYADSEIRKAINALGNIDLKISRAMREAIETSEEYTDEKCLDLADKISGIQANLILLINQRLAEVNNRIDNIIKEYPYLYDPSTGKSEDMQSVIYEIYKHLRYFGSKAMEYDEQELTAEEYDGKSLMAYKYDTLFKQILGLDLFDMFDPFTGAMSNVKDVLLSLVRRLQWNAKTSSEADGFEATASEIDASTFTAYEQDTNKYLTSRGTSFNNLRNSFLRGMQVPFKRIQDSGNNSRRFEIDFSTYQSIDGFYLRSLNNLKNDIIFRKETLQWILDSYPNPTYRPMFVTKQFSTFETGDYALGFSAVLIDDTQPATSENVDKIIIQAFTCTDADNNVFTPSGSIISYIAGFIEYRDVVDLDKHLPYQDA